jgi:hypothetical protein
MQYDPSSFSIQNPPPKDKKWVIVF